MTQTLTNNLLSVTASDHGAELQSIKNRLTGQEYLWQGDSCFWGRRSPVLFPIVGAVWDGKYRMDGAEWAMGQHGFARDCDFKVMEVDEDDEMWFALESDDQTLAVYPRRFRLEIGYRLQEARISVMWRVRNLDERPMHFQIGAHPAFNLPGFNPADRVRGYIAFDTEEGLSAEVISTKGCIGKELRPVSLTDGMLPLTADTFKNDAIILDNGQVHRVSLLDSHRAPYLTLIFGAPLVGLWAPKPEAPFVCIEPWWGRADSEGFSGDFADRHAVQTLEPGQTFEASYMIIADNF